MILLRLFQIIRCIRIELTRTIKLGEPSSNTWPDPQHVGIPPFPMESRSHWLKPIGENTQRLLQYGELQQARTTSHQSGHGF